MSEELSPYSQLRLDKQRGNHILDRMNRLEQAQQDQQSRFLSLRSAEKHYVKQYCLNPFTGWYKSSTPANTSATGLDWDASPYPALQMPFAGSVRAMSVAVDSSRTAGTLTVTVYVAGSATEFYVEIDEDSPDYVMAQAGAGQVSFEAGEAIQPFWETDSSWAPTSANITDVVLWVDLEIEA